MSYLVADDRRQWPALVPMFIAALLTGYTAVRYGFRWAETDTAAFIRAIRTIENEATIQSTNAYPNGFAYQSLIVTISELTGLSVVVLQLAVLPFLSVVVALSAFVAMRALTGSSLLGGLAALLLFIQPEFLFVVQRGNHEKVTHIFLLMLVFLLVYSTSREHPLPVLAALIFSYYVILWSVITTNSFFASSFVSGFCLAVLGLVPALRYARSRVSLHRPLLRLRFTAVASIVLLFLFTTFVYPPAEHGVALYRIMFDQVSSLVLAEESTAESPYVGIQLAWSPRWMYPILASFTFTIAIGAAVTWFWLALRFRRNGIPVTERHLLVLWLLTGAFAVQILVSAVVDYSGFLEGNLQVRLLPVYMLFAVPMAVVGIMTLYERAGAQVRRNLAYAAPVLITLFAVVGILKATNDPLVSNKWLFFTEDEQHALVWVNDSLNGREIWIGIDERLRMMQDIHQPVDPGRGNIYRTGYGVEMPSYALSTDVMQRRFLRMNIPVNDHRLDDRIYDNGAAHVYHRVPQTRYQP